MKPLLSLVVLLLLSAEPTGRPGGCTGPGFERAAAEWRGAVRQWEAWVAAKRAAVPEEADEAAKRPAVPGEADEAAKRAAVPEEADEAANESGVPAWQVKVDAARAATAAKDYETAHSLLAEASRLGAPDAVVFPLRSENHRLRRQDPEGK